MSGDLKLKSSSHNSAPENRDVHSKPIDWPSIIAALIILIVWAVWIFWGRG